jgi:3-phosphoshikimate 1-carboxyvinyltransferase
LSSASYFFSLVALSDSASITLTSYKENSLQGDSALVEIYKQMGVDSRFENNSLILTKDINFIPATLNLDLNNTPDIAQTSTCLGLGVGCHLAYLKKRDR